MRNVISGASITVSERYTMNSGPCKLKRVLPSNRARKMHKAREQAKETHSFQKRNCGEGGA